MPFLNESNSFSFLNSTYGLPRWIGLAWLKGYVSINSNEGYYSVSAAEMQDVFTEFINDFLIASYGGDNGNYTALQIDRATAAVSAMTKFIGSVWLYPYSTLSRTLQLLAFTEFDETDSPVVRTFPLFRWFGYFSLNASYCSRYLLYIDRFALHSVSHVSGNLGSCELTTISAQPYPYLPRPSPA